MKKRIIGATLITVVCALLISNLVGVLLFRSREMDAARNTLQELLVLMDELGFLERCSPVFQRAVFTLLDGPTPVLGVLRRHEKSPFWGPVSRRADVRLLPLTVENRAEIPAELTRLLG